VFEIHVLTAVLCIIAPMDELLLPVTYRNEELELPIRMFPYGWTFRIAVKVDGKELFFEPDEEGVLRALGEVEIGPALIRVIANELEKLR